MSPILMEATSIVDTVKPALTEAATNVTDVMGTALPIVLGVVGLGVAYGVVTRWVKKIKG
jgi:uncharacterized membrane protein YeaQ/YmgE (transglycosylase-associated protein family)